MKLKRWYAILLNLFSLSMLIISAIVFIEGDSFDHILSFNLPYLFTLILFEHPFLVCFLFFILFCMYVKNKTPKQEPSYFYRKRFIWIKTECCIVFVYALPGILNQISEIFHIKNLHHDDVFWFLLPFLIFILPLFLYCSVASSIGFLIEAVREHKAKKQNTP